MWFWGRLKGNLRPLSCFERSMIQTKDHRWFFRMRRTNCKSEVSCKNDSHKLLQGHIALGTQDISQGKSVWVVDSLRHFSFWKQDTTKLRACMQQLRKSANECLKHGGSGDDEEAKPSGSRTARHGIMTHDILRHSAGWTLSPKWNLSGRCFHIFALVCCCQSFVVVAVVSLGLEHMLLAQRFQHDFLRKPITVIKNGLEKALTSTQTMGCCFCFWSSGVKVRVRRLEVRTPFRHSLRKAKPSHLICMLVVWPSGKNFNMASILHWSWVASNHIKPFCSELASFFLLGHGVALAIYEDRSKAPCKGFSKGWPLKCFKSGLRKLRESIFFFAKELRQKGSAKGGRKFRER